MKTNEFGDHLDSTGYGPQVIPWPDDRCFVCGRMDRPLQRHEVFHGAYRTKSKAYGCWILICDYCHTKIHKQDDLTERKLKIIMQHKAMQKYGWSIDRWREVFGKNYSEET
jgi:hypothetical protein